MELARLKNPISLQQLTAHLLDLGFDCCNHGRDIQIDKFCSIKKIEEAGLYYLTDFVDINISEIKNSIIISNHITPFLDNSNSFLIVNEPQLAYYKLSCICFRNNETYGIHSTAIIHPDRE